MKKVFHVYFLTNKNSNVLYVGVTSNLEQRIWQHKKKLIDGFSKTYNLDRLVYFEEYLDAEAAISREKQIKKWRRDKKDYLVNKMNPEWKDLSLDWYGDPSTSLGMTGNTSQGMAGKK